MLRNSNKARMGKAEVIKHLPDARELWKYAAHGFMCKGFAAFMRYQVEAMQSGSTSSVRDRILGGLIAAGRGGLVGAYQTPIYACIDNAVTVSLRDKSRTELFVSRAAAFWGSTALFGNPPFLPSIHRFERATKLN